MPTRSESQRRLTEEKARAASRLSGAFVLRTLEMLSRLADGDLMMGLVSLAIVQANVDHLDAAGGDGRYDGVAFVPPDEARRPVSVLALSASLGMPYETTRRNVGRLLDRGICQRVKGGVILRASALESEAHREMLRTNMGNLRRLLHSLDAARISF